MGETVQDGETLGQRFTRFIEERAKGAGPSAEVGVLREGAWSLAHVPLVDADTVTYQQSQSDLTEPPVYSIYFSLDEKERRRIDYYSDDSTFLERRTDRDGDVYDMTISVADVERTMADILELEASGHLLRQ